MIFFFTYNSKWMEHIPAEGVGASSVNMFLNKFDIYLKL